MHAARLESSPRLQRVLALLQDGHEYTTRDIIERAHVCAVNSCVAELNEQGYQIVCERRGRYWYYRLSEPAQLELVA